MPPPDHDWEIIARRDPFFGVVSAPEYRAGAMSEDARLRFYQSGEADIARILGWFDQDLGGRPTSGCALDIGCGVGRLAHALAGVMPQAAGYDISPTMIDLARQNAPPNLTLSTELPEGPFAWINSYMVFQHIPPPEGLKLLETCVARAAADAFLSLQITAWRDGPQPRAGLGPRLWRNALRALHRQSGPADPLIQMHDYNLSEVIRIAVAAGFSRISLRHTQHGQHHGVWVLSRRTP